MNASPITEASVPRLPRGVRLTDSPSQGGMVLLAPERVFKADAIAVAILQRCDGKATVAHIVDALSAAYNAPRERIATDVKTLLGLLADKQLLEV